MINIVFFNRPITSHPCGQSLILTTVFKVLASMVIVRPSFEFHLVHSSRKTNEYHIGVWLIDKLALLYLFQAINKLRGIIVGLTSKAKPKIIFEVAFDLSRQITMFGKKVPRLLAS